jgi:hypothetical protein
VRPPALVLAVTGIAAVGVAACGSPSATSSANASTTTAATAAKDADATTTTTAGTMTGAKARQGAHDICLGQFQKGGVLGAAAENGITLSAAQQQRPAAEETERELLVGIGQRVADPFGYAFDEAREGCDQAYEEWVRGGRLIGGKPSEQP